MVMMVTFGDAHDGNGDDVHVGDENLPSSDCSTEPRPESGLKSLFNRTIQFLSVSVFYPKTVKS